MTTGWERELTRLERDVNAALALLADGEAPPAERWSPPDALGPLPDHLRPRVESLLTRLADATREAATKRDELSKELGDLHNRRDIARAYQRSDQPVGPAADGDRVHRTTSTPVDLPLGQPATTRTNPYDRSYDSSS